MRRVHKRWIWGIVLLAAVLRFVHIDAQPVGHHGWRQADTAAVARNFHEQGYRLFRPQIDWAIPGYVEMEFPLYPWVVSLAYGALGEHIALARMLSAVASVVSVLFVFLLVKRILGDDEALWAAGLWAILPLSIYFGRATMPESWMLAFSIAGVYQFSRWVERSSLTLLLTSAVCIALACLLKPTSLYLGLPLLWLAWRQYGPALFARWQLWLFAAVITIPVAAWYWHAHWLGATYGATFGVFTGSSGKLGHWELLLQPGFYNRLFLDFFADRVLTWFGFLLFLVGLLLSRHHTRERLFDVWLLGAIIMLLVGSGASSVHEYYALPLMVPSVAFMGRALTWIRPRSRTFLVVFVLGISIASLVRWTSYLRMERTEGSSSGKVTQDRRIAEILSQHTTSTDLLISCDHSNPTWLYLARRKGFGKNCDAMDKPAVAALEKDGARYLVARHADFRSDEGSVLLLHLLSARTVLHDDGEILLVDLTQPLLVPRIWRPLLADGFDDDALPARWRFETGVWREENSTLMGEPTRRRLHARPDWNGCSICAITVTLSPTISSPGRRKASFSLTGWSEDETFVDITLDLSSGRVRFEQTENGTVVARAAATWPLVDGRTYALDAWFDGFDFHILLDGHLVLTVPNRAHEPPFGRMTLRGQNIRLAIDDLSVLGPPGFDVSADTGSTEWSLDR